MPAIRAVVFDLDGLMFNTEEVFNHAGRELLRRRDRELTHDLLSRMMGRRAHEAFAIMKELVGLSESVDELLAESSLIFSEMLERHLAPMPGLFELLDLIEARPLRKAVATSSHRTYLEGILDRFRLRERFHFTLSAEDVTHGKPHPEIYLKAAATLGISPAEMLVLEDSEAGTQAAAAAGAVIVSVPHAHSRTHNFGAAAHVATSLLDPFIVDLVAAAASDKTSAATSAPSPPLGSSTCSRA